MFVSQNVAPAIFTTKCRLTLGGSLAALTLMAAATPAWADNECGTVPANGVVTCTSANNPYANGITYIVPPVDLTINMNPDVIVDTGGTFGIGVLGLATGTQSLTLKAAPATIIRTSDPGSYGVLLATDSGAINATTGIIRTTGANATGIFTSTASGNTTIVGGTTTTTGNNALGIEANNNSGFINVTSGTISTSGANATGVLVRSDVGNVTINGGAITTLGASSVGAGAQTGGAGIATINGGTITTSGTNAFGAVATAGAGGAIVTPASVTTSGIGADAIRVTSNGGTARAGATTISTTGANARGIVITGTAGATVNYGTITTTGAGATGIFVPAGVMFFGPQATSSATIAGTGPLRTSGANADGINVTATNAVTINVGQVATSGTNSRGIAVRGGGAVNVTAAGVTTTGTNASGILATSTGSSVGVTLSGTNSSTSVDGATIAAATTANLALTSGTLDGANNGATITSGTGTTVTNAGTISGGNYALSISGGAATVANTGTISGRILLTGNADTVTNAGTFNANASSDFGAGNDVFNNSGTLRVLGQSATAGTVNFTGLETLNNNGLVDLRNGHVGDVLALPGSYSGSGAATLGVDVLLGTATGTADQLRLGGAATGSTVVTINALNTTPAVLSTSTGTVLVQAGAASAATAFTLNGANVDQGLIQYGIMYNPTTFAYSLVGTPGAGVYRTALFAESARNLWLQSGDAWSGHMRELRDNVAANGPGGAGGRVWAQAIGQVEQRTNTRTFTYNGIIAPINLGYKQDYFGGQIGLDFGAPAGEGAFAFGITGGYLNSKMNFANSADRIDFDAINGGLYASYTSGIFFVNALGKYDYYWGRNQSISGNYSQRLKGAVYGGKGEVGFRVGKALWIEPSASVSYTHSDIDNFGVASGAFNFNDADGVRGKGGARLGFTTDAGSAKLTLYAGGNYVHEFKGNDQVAFVSGGQTATFANQRVGDYGEGTLGVNIGSQQGAISGFFEGRYANGGDYEGYGGRAGVRFRF